ncbi:SGNH/GDSL hydrolase family protein [Mesobacillus harenae]|uniref:SGNH/GDSL hydrolase family protein n=1 Tax=Mesobacillus harenae TaxID=2213203 RepID=UPI001580200D|nr:SGNH/GDSL hydrolase family protein [Mesobacillus harenae]
MRKIFTMFLLCLLVLISCNPLNSSIEKEFHISKEVHYRNKLSPEPDFFPRQINIVAAGDSLTEGIGDSTKRGGYLPYLEELIEKEKNIREVRMDNFGIKGNKSSQLIDRIKSEEVRTSIRESDMVILTIGGNDVMKVVRENFTQLELDPFNVERSNYEKRLVTILNEIRSINNETMVVLVGLYNPFYKWFTDIEEMNDIIDEWNSVSRSIVARYPSAYFVEIGDIFQTEEENLLYTDQFHPNDRGYELMAQRIFESLGGEPLKSIARNAYTASEKGNSD